jgi:D-aspartate ligase
MLCIEDISTPVVVLKTGGMGSLGVVRSLGRLGIPVYSIGPNANSPTFRSRYLRGSFVTDCEIADAPPMVALEHLLDVSRKIGRRAILITTRDEDISFIAKHAGRLREGYVFPDQSLELVRSLVSKKELFFLAKKHGVSTPETIFPQSKQDVIKFLDIVKFPVMLKAIDPPILQKRTGKRLVLVHGPAELLDQYQTLETPESPNLMLQEYIPGGDESIWMFDGYFNSHSECLLAVTGKKIRQYPAYTGVTCLGICVRNDTVERTTKEFMKALGYGGPVDIGYRYDSRDGQYKILDVNPRLGDTFRLFVADNGLDVPRALYLDLTAQPVPFAVMRDGRKWVSEWLDLVSSLRYYRDGKLTIRQWLSSFRGVQEAAFFALDDPLPFLTMCADAARQFSKRFARSLDS